MTTLGELMLGRAPKPNKYRAKATIVDGIRFASKGEADRWCLLKLRERAGEIKGLERQVTYRLYGVRVNCEHDDSATEVAKFIADFRYWEKDGPSNLREVVEDFKGVETPVFKIKRRLMKACHGIEVSIVRR